MTAARFYIAIMLLGFVAPVYAVIETYEFSEPELEVRYQKLSAELRCPKCQNQNIADSNAPISQDLRKLLHQQLEAGASDEQILNHMEQRYGEFVRYRPKFSGVTSILWLAPVALLLLGLAILFFTIRRRALERDLQSAELTTEEQQRVESLLKTENPER
jgi:cytochrome c-type biogenesis protein CcmH